MSPLLFLFFALISHATTIRDSSPRALLEQQRIHELAAHPQWLRLGHYRKTFFGWESELDGAAFFVASNGKRDPAAELVATWEGLTSADEVDEDQSIACRFPARTKWLHRNMREFAGRWPKPNCPKLDKWVAAVSGPSVSLVFSSYYLNNPASAFGHTLLRVNKEASRKDGRRHELLDYGVNFAANPTTDNPLMYSLLGLFGGFPGTFTITPYYYKVREYNNAESRDLWEYELSLSPDATDTLVRHFWELGPTFADYWYLTENCSYHMLTVLEAADPSLDLTSRLKKYVLPGDTLKVVETTPGLVRSFRFRPSIRAEFEARTAVLDDEEADVLQQILETRTIPGDWRDRSEDSRRRILDAGIDGVDFRFSHEVQLPDTPETKFKNLLLAERARVDLISPALKLEPPMREAPHLSHGSRKFLIGGQGGGAGEGSLLGYRFALHDLLDPVTGYPDSAQIHFFDARFLYSNDERRFRLEEFGLFEVITLTPRTRFSSPLSWRLRVALDRELSREAFGVLGARISGGAGYAVSFGNMTGYLGLQGAVIDRVESVGRQEIPSPRAFAAAGPALTLRYLAADHLIGLLDVFAFSEASDRQRWTPHAAVGMQWSPWREIGFRASWKGNDVEGVWAVEASFFH